MVADRTFTSEFDALAWASLHFANTEARLIRDAPWSRIYALSGETEFAVLKVLPIGSAAPAVAPVLSRCFPGNVPDVIASDLQSGLILMRGYDGTEMGDEATTEQLTKLVKTYATIQAAAAHESELLSCLPKPDMTALLSNALKFVHPDGEKPDVAGAVVDATFYLDRKTLNRYSELLTRRRSLLERLLSLTTKLPTTVNHCDLRAHNAVTLPSGSCVLYDWDDAVAGPAGLSVHTLYTGCSIPVMVLSEDALTRDAVRGRGKLLNVYLTELSSAGYADTATLKQCVPASALAGALQYFLYYSRHPKDSERYKKKVASKLRKRLSDLLDVCDHLVLRYDDEILAYALDYLRHHRRRRAENLLRSYLIRFPDNAEARTLLGMCR